MMQTSLERIATKAEKDKAHRFQNLYGLLNEELLYDSWQKLNKKAAAGVDGVKYDGYNENIAENIQLLTAKLKEKRYHARLVRRQHIPKGNGKTRHLGIPVMEDKLVQHAVSQVLQAIYEQDFYECFYGYRKSRGAKDAVKDLRKALQDDGYIFVVEADIKGYFDSIDHDWLVRMLEQRIDDNALIQLIKKWLKAGVLDTEGEVIHPLTGTPQGGVLSPVLSNVYLHYVLGLWFEKVVKRHCRGKACLWAYADDFVCAFEYREDAYRFYNVLEKRLHKFNLELAHEKSGIVYVGRWSKDHFNFLGFEFRVGRMRRRCICIRTTPQKLRNSLKAIKTWCRENRHKKLYYLFSHLNAKLRGYYNYYGLEGNSKSLYVFHYALMKALYKWLNRRSQKKSMRWEKFLHVIEYHNLVMPCLEIV